MQPVTSSDHIWLIYYNKAFLCTGQITTTDEIQVLGSLEAVSGEDLSVFCMVGPGITSTEVVLRQGDELVRESQDNNSTHVLFILSNVMASDNGRIITCGISEFRSRARSITIFCKILEATCMIVVHVHGWEFLY